MKYLLLKNKPHGVLLDRTPVETEGDLRIELEGLPAGEYTAVFVLDGGQSRIYRKVEDGIATLERELIESFYGEMYICVKDAELTREWSLDGVICAGCRIFPDDRANGALVAELRHEMDVLLCELASMRKTVEGFSARVSEIYDGYDLL